MNHLIHKMADVANQDLNKYWPGFKQVAYALYDHEQVYLFNHPDYQHKKNPAVIPRQHEIFNGADTLILFANFPTAIVNLSRHQNLADVYAILVHELFHGFQYLQQEQRLPNEVLGMTYPISKENIEIRTRERNLLYKAIFTENEQDQKTFIQKFIQLRTRRKRLLGDFFTYELAVETVEGPARHIELLAYADMSGVDREELIKDYLNPLIDAEEANRQIRKSCYHSGLAICLLLGKYDSRWQKNFFTSEKLLYDYLTEIFPVDNDSLSDEEVLISPESEEMAAKITALKDKQFHQFAKQKGHHIFIEGNITIKAFDPMNVIANHRKMLHKNFLKIQIQQNEYLLTKPVISYYQDPFTKVEKLYLVSDEQPQTKDDFIQIQGIGNIQGTITKENGNYYIRNK